MINKSWPVYLTRRNRVHKALKETVKLNPLDGAMINITFLMNSDVLASRRISMEIENQLIESLIYNEITTRI